MKKATLFTFLLALFCQFGFTQKVGVVLSGGGSSGISHIGVLKVLEENEIPIDYIAGTSMGALVAAMYASGMSPEEMEKKVLSPEFANQAKGIIEDQYKYYFKSHESNSSWVSLRFNRDKDSILKTSLPTNIIDPYSMDFAMMEYLAGASAACNYKFDSLFVPFRCVAADVANKKEVVFKEGDLAQAVRASVSYPFYLKPITVNGSLLFDGGLYNNFPSDVMLEDFFPDIIIGSTVAGELQPPDPDDIYSQVKNMLMYRTDYSIPCENGIIIQPEIDKVSLFDFSHNAELIAGGEKGAMKKIEEILLSVQRRIPLEERQKQRENFNSQKPELVFDDIYINGLNRLQAKYVRNSLRQKKEVITIDQLRREYFKLVADDKLKNIYPKARYDKSSGNYDLFLDIARDNDLILQFGGNFTSRAANHAFVGAQYKYLSSWAVSLQANAYFGQLYTSGRLKARVDFPLAVPFYIESSGTYNQWDYFASNVNFFEDPGESFLVQTDGDWEIKFGFPATYKGKITTGINISWFVNEYYQTPDFKSTDTTDRGIFSNFSPHVAYETSTLNRKQFANAGKYFTIRARYVESDEVNRPGTTSLYHQTINDYHRWWQVKAIYDNYFKERGKLRLGMYLEGLFSSQPFFGNYASTVQMAPAFEPIPESQTFFFDDFRAHVYAAAGLKTIFEIRDNLDLRLEGYGFQPYQRIIKTNDFKAAYADPEFNPLFIGSSVLVFNSPIGPVSLSANYYDRQEKPWSFMFSLGYMIYNESALD